MKLIIAGSRTLTPCPETLFYFVDEFALFSKVTEVVSGAARGVDSCGEQFAERYRLAVRRFPADWDKYGRSAGFRRNEEMGAYADALLLVWDGESRGSADMRQRMLNRQKPVYEVILRKAVE